MIRPCSLKRRDSRRWTRISARTCSSGSARARKCLKSADKHSLAAHLLEFKPKWQSAGSQQRSLPKPSMIHIVLAAFAGITAVL